MDRSASSLRGASRLQPSSGPRRSSWPRRALLALVVLHVLLGACWLALNVGEVPYYGDTRDYLSQSRSLVVDPYRGFAYPLLLSLADRLDERSMLEVWGALAKETQTGAQVSRLAPGFLVVQLVQLAVFAAALLYFLRVFAARLESRLGPRFGLGRGGWVLLFLLLFTDPVLAHFQLAVMTDGLAFSGSLVACAALVAFAASRALRPGAGLLLFAGVLLASGLRVEKAWVLAGTALVTLAWWLWRARGAYPRALPAAAIVLLGVACAVLLQRGLADESRGWRTHERVLNQRVIYRHLATDYDRLPADVRAHLSREQAERHGGSIMTAQRVMEEVTQGDTALRGELIASAAGVVLREHWPGVLLGVAQDTVENVAATADFYGHLAVLVFAGNETFDRLFPGDFTRWTYTRIGQHHRPLTKLYMASSVALLLLAAAATLAMVVGRRRNRAAQTALEAGGELDGWFDWVPVAAFVLFNAVAFALAADVITIRYTLFAHTLLLLVVFRGGLRWAGSPG